MNIPDIYIQNSEVLADYNGVRYFRVNVVFKQVGDEQPEPYCIGDRWVTSEAAQIGQLMITIEKLKADLLRHQVAPKNNGGTVPLSNQIRCELCGKIMDKRGFGTHKRIKHKEGS